MIGLFKNNTPRWIIFLFDIVVAVLSLLFAFLLRFNFNIPEKEFQYFPVAFASLFIVRLLLNVFFKTYAGIIRYTSTEDAGRIFIGTLLGSILLVVGNLIRFHLVDGVYLLPFSVLIIEFLSTTFFLISFRIGIKVLYFELKNPRKDRSNVIIYGAGEAGMITKRSIENDKKSRMKVVAFVDDSAKMTNKKIDGVKIYNTKTLDQLIDDSEATHLIISSKTISKANKSLVIEKCLNKSIGVLSVPPVNKWINGELSFKQIKQVDVEDLLERSPINLDTNKISKSVSEKVILVTGAAGSIGSEIVRQLMHFSSKKIVLLDFAESALYELDYELQNGLHKSPYEVVIGDVRNKHRMQNVFETFKPNLVYHAAAYKHVPLMEVNPTESVNTNIFGTKIIADLCLEYQVEKMVFVSTDKAVKPTNVMGATKRTAEMYIQGLNTETTTKFVTTRFGNVLGSNGSVIPVFKKQIAKGGPVVVTDPEITRYFMTIPEACQLVLQAGTLGKGGEVFVFDMGESVKIVDLAKKMIKLSGLELGKDIQIVFSGLRPGEKLYEELLTDNEITLPTPHNKIKVAKVEDVDLAAINLQLAELNDFFESQNNEAIIQKLQEIVKEYKRKTVDG